MIHTKFIALMFVSMLMQAGISDTAINNQELRRHFNHAVLVHIEGLGFALAQKDVYPAVNPERGLAQFWQQLMLDGGIDALLGDAEVCALAEELHAAVMSKQAVRDALDQLHAQTTSQDADALNCARFHMQAIYVAGLVEEAQQRGCMFRRPDTAPQLADLTPGQGGSFIAAESKNWGDLEYLAGLLHANAELDVTTHACLLRAFTVAQLIFRAGQA